MDINTEKIKEHLRKHKVAYSCALTAVSVAGITAVIMRHKFSQPISVTIGDAASRTIGVAGKKVVMSNVSFINSNRQGPPSWVTRCVETGQIWASQRSAAIDMNLAPDHLSQHLNGTRDHVNGYHFERICLAG